MDSNQKNKCANCKIQSCIKCDCKLQLSKEDLSSNNKCKSSSITQCINGQFFNGCNNSMILDDADNQCPFSFDFENIWSAPANNINVPLN